MPIVHFDGFDDLPITPAGESSADLVQAGYAYAGVLSSPGNGFLVAVRPSNRWADDSGCSELAFIGQGAASGTRAQVSLGLPVVGRQRWYAGLAMRVERDAPMPATRSNLLGIGFTAAPLAFIQTDGSIAATAAGIGDREAVAVDGQWRYIELCVDGTSLTVWVDDAVIVERTIASITPTAFTLSALRFDGAAPHSIGIRDIYISYGPDSQRIGRTARVVPRWGDTDVQADFERTTGVSNASVVSHRDPVDDARSVSADVVGATDLYTSGDALPEGANIIHAVAIRQAARRTDEAEHMSFPVIQQAGKREYGAPGLSLSGTYKAKSNVFERRPDGGVWTPATWRASAFGAVLDGAGVHDDPVVGVWQFGRHEPSAFVHVNADDVPVVVTSEYWYHHPIYSAIELVYVGEEAMVKFPAFWYRRQAESWSISPMPREGYTLHPAFMWHGHPRPYIAISAYLCGLVDGKAVSRAGVPASMNISPAQWRSAIANRADGAVGGTFTMPDIFHGAVVQMLGLIETASGNGIPVSWRGLHNFYSAGWFFVDGLEVPVGAEMSVRDYDGYGTFVPTGITFPDAPKIGQVGGAAIRYAGGNGGLLGAAFIPIEYGDLGAFPGSIFCEPGSGTALGSSGTISSQSMFSIIVSGASASPVRGARMVWIPDQV